MRLIDADELKKRYIEQMKHLIEYTTVNMSAEAISLLCGSALIDDSPTIECEIIRCRDCKHNSLGENSPNVLCDLFYGSHYPGGFCDMGEVR